MTKTNRLYLAVLWLVLGAAAVNAADAQEHPNVQNGNKLFLTVGCYECHGTTGGGANTGPRIAPGPIPFAAFVYQLRHPLGTPPYGNMRMPAYTAKVLSDTQVADIYAYLVSIKPGPPADRIPLLMR